MKDMCKGCVQGVFEGDVAVLLLISVEQFRHPRAWTLAVVGKRCLLRRNKPVGGSRSRKNVSNDKEAHDERRRY